MHGNVMGKSSVAPQQNGLCLKSWLDQRPFYSVRFALFPSVFSRYEKLQTPTTCIYKLIGDCKGNTVNECCCHSWTELSHFDALQ